MLTKRSMIWLRGGSEGTSESITHERCVDICVERQVSLRFIRPFEVLERIDDVAYRLALPPRILGVHSVFHDCMLQQHHEDTSQVLDFSALHLHKESAYVEELAVILTDIFRR